MIDQAVLFLLGVQRFIRAIETVFIDTVSMIIPWLAPLVPAYLAYRSMTDTLGFPLWLAGATAGVIEMLGLATINTAFLFWSYNHEKRKIDPKSPVPLAVLVSIYYLAVVLTVNTMLDADPLIYKTAKGLLTSISVVGGVTIALRASHSRRVQEIENEKERRRYERRFGAGKFARAEISTPSLDAANAMRRERSEEAKYRLMEFCRVNPQASISQIAKAIGRSRPTVYGYLEELEQAHKIKNNGNGIEVL